MVRLETSLTRLLGIDVPVIQAPIGSATVERWEEAGRPESGRRPGEGETVARFPDGAPVLRYSDVPPLPGMTGDIEALAFYAGQSAGLANRVEPASEILRQIVEEALDALARLSGETASNSGPRAGGHGR